MRSQAVPRRSTREAIIEVATRLMQVRGYTATSLDDVLRESGVGKGTFYYHFKSKEDLGYAILDAIVAAFLGRTLDPCFSDPAVKPLARIRCFLDRLVVIQRELHCVGCPLGTLASELSDVHEGFRARLAGVFSAWRDCLVQALREGQQQGDIPGDCQVESVAQFLVASLEGAILMSKVTKDITVMERCVNEMKRYLALWESGR